jgi:hypothetical protein
MTRSPFALGAAFLAALFVWDGCVLAAPLPVPNPYARANAVDTGPGRREIFNKLRRIKLENLACDKLPLGEVINRLWDEARKRDPAREGINFLFSNQTGRPRIPVPDPASSHPFPCRDPNQIMSVEVRVFPTQQNITIEEIIQLAKLPPP